LVQPPASGGALAYVTVREYARALAVSTATVYRAVALGQIPHVRVSNAIRIPSAEQGSVPGDGLRTLPSWRDRGGAD
jgi:excisionase family DNA binding protein